MSSSERFVKVVLGGLLALHALWIGNHLRWVANDRINPWKLGGYGMYTVPSTGTTLAIMDMTDADAPALLTSRDIDASGFMAARSWFNYRRSFRCLHPSENSLRVFLEENPQLAGVPILLYFSDRTFVRKPVAVRYREQGRILVDWDEEARRFHYESRFCGDTKTGSIIPGTQ